MEGDATGAAARNQRCGPVRVQPGDALREIGADLGCAGGAAGQRDSGDIDGGDLPAVLGQPDSVCALAAADVECATGGEAGRLGDEMRVGVAAPHCTGGTVTRVPEGLVRDVHSTTPVVFVAVASVPG